MRRDLLKFMLWAGIIGAALAKPVSAEPARANYVLYCSGCHGMSGEGTRSGGVPAFPGSVSLIAGSDSGRTYITHVPGVISNSMDDAEIADVLNYILDEWGDGGAHFTGEEVTTRRREDIGDVVAFRRHVVRELQASGIEIAEYPWP